MNFHIFVFFTTVVFYIVLRSYKSQITNTSTDAFDLKKSARKQSPNKQTQSNLIYVLFIPAILYVVKFLYGCSTNVTLTQFNASNASNASTVSNGSVLSERLLTYPYPDSSVNVSTVST